MNKKKIINRILIVMLAVAMLTGCGNAIPEMTEAEEQQIVEYAAQLLYTHTRHYKANMLTEEEQRKAEQDLIDEAALQAMVASQKAAQAAKAEEEANNHGSSDSDGDVVSEPVYQDIDEFLELQGISVEYAGYLVGSTYPEQTEDNDWQGICKASGNNKLVVFLFDVTNESGADINLDMASRKVNISFKINGRKSKSALTTLLANDFLMYRGNITAGETVQMVVIIELSSDDADELSSATMTMKYNGNRADTTLF